MTKKEKFQALAKKLVDKYTIGLCVLRTYSESYDTETGLNTTVDVHHPQNAAYDEYRLAKHPDLNYAKQHFVLILAGIDLVVVPQINMTIIMPSGTEHVVSDIEKDQYDAAYFLHVKK